MTKRDESGQEVIPCTTCGDDTAMLGTKLCGPCLQLDWYFRDLVQRDKAMAHDWLQKQVAELAGYGAKV